MEDGPSSKTWKGVAITSKTEHVRINGRMKLGPNDNPDNYPKRFCILPNEAAAAQLPRLVHPHFRVDTFLQRCIRV
jgi:hypothetical protein